MQGLSPNLKVITSRVPFLIPNGYLALTRNTYFGLKASKGSIGVQQPWRELLMYLEGRLHLVIRLTKRALGQKGVRL